MSILPQQQTLDPNTFGGRIEAFGHAALRPYRRLSKKSKYAVWLIALAHFIAIAIIVIITPRRIGHFFNSVALNLRAMGWKGMLVMSIVVVLTSHPPLFGFSGSMTLIGFAYGIWPGFLIAILSAFVGGAISFLSVRTFFLGWMRKFGSGKNQKWEAFGHVMREKGWPLVAMIRWCPLPWAVGNGLFASIEGVKFWHYLLANFLYLPRLLIPVFIGSRLNSLTDEDQQPDPLRFWLNLLSIGLTILVSVLTGVWIYHLTLAQMRKLDQRERQGEAGDGGESEQGGVGEGELAAEALEQSALLGDYSGDEGEEEELVPQQHANGQAKPTYSAV